MTRQSVAIIGGGVVGLAIARELAQSGYDVFLFEQGEFFGPAQSSRNSGVIHAGIYYTPRSLKARLCVQGREMLYGFCREHNVPFLKTGKLIVARDEAEDQELDFYSLRGRENGAGDLKKITRSELKEMEPDIEGYSALFSPETGIIDAGKYVEKLARLAEDAGAQLFCNRKVSGISKFGSKFTLWVHDIYRGSGVSQETIFGEVDWVVNAAGVYADEVAAFIKPDRKVAYKIIPVRGEYYYYSSAKKPELAIRHCIYGLPTETPALSGWKIPGLGIHLVPTFANGDGIKRSDIVLVGPSTKVVSHKDDYTDDLFPPEYFLSAMKPVLPAFELGDLKEGYAGIRAELFGCDDFLIRPDESFSQFINLFGIRSPGLTASLAIAKYLTDEFFLKHN